MTGLREVKDAAVAQARAELPTPGWLDTHGAAAYLSVTRKQLEHWRSAGGGPPYSKHGRFLRYSRVALDAWMAGLQVRSTAEVSRG